MMGNNQNLFFSQEEKGRAFSDVLKEVQEYISSKYSTLMVEGGNDEVKQQVKRYISKYIADYRITVKGKTREELINDLYTEMAEFSFLTKYIFGTGIEEIDINSWKDIEVQYRSSLDCRIRYPYTECCFIIANSSSVSRAALFRISLGTFDFPISCKSPAIPIS